MKERDKATILRTVHRSLHLCKDCKVQFHNTYFSMRPTRRISDLDELDRYLKWLHDKELDLEYTHEIETLPKIAKILGEARHEQDTKG